MLSNNRDLKEELIDYQLALGIVSKEYLDEKDIDKVSEQADVYVEDIDGKKTYYKLVNTSGLSDNEIGELIEYKKLKKINTIKNCSVFFVTLTVISLILFFIFQALS